MYVSQVYKYEKDGIVYVGGFVPEGATVLETMDILNANEGFELVRISDTENVGTSIWLHDGDVMENYKEVEAKDEQD